MVSFTCATDRRDGVTLVTARLAGAGVAQRVRLANRLDGPVWPPRRQGVPEAGWDGDRFETVVPAGKTVAVGYASPAPPTDPPLAIVEREVVDEDCGDDASTVADAIRDLGDPSPPRDAVPIPVDGVPGTEEQAESERDNRHRPDRSLTAESERSPTQHANTALPDAVESWFDAVEERVATAEDLAAAETVPEATAAMREAGSLDDAEALVETLRDDADALAVVAGRADRIADRASAADVPLETFERLA